MRTLASRSVFPAFLIVVLGGALALVERGVAPEIVLLATFAFSAVAIALLERALPYRREWNRSHGDLGVDTAYLPMTFGVNALIEPAVTTAAVAIGGAISRSAGMGLWPSEWPLLAQLALACVIAEFFDYWAHRVMHESAWLWRFHATHHSAPRLYWLNTTRSHPLEMMFRGAVAIGPLALLGVSESVLALFGVVNITVGLWQHANVDFALGPLSWIFSVGAMHRWHHSPEAVEANTNYGNNFLFWDVVFGTRYLPVGRPAPENPGIGGLGAFPRTLGAQLVAPWRWDVLAGAPSSRG